MLQLDRHVPSPGVPEYNRRFAWLVGVVVVAFLLLLGRIWQLQVVRGEDYYERSANNFLAEDFIPAVRGKIKDRLGNTLVDNRPSFNVYAIPRYFTPQAHQALVQLLGLDAMTQSRLQAKLTRAKGRKEPVLLLEDVGRDQLALIEQSRSELPGVEVRDVPHRNYLYGTVAAHVLGYLNQITEEELEARRDEGYDDGDYVGRYGIEKEWEHFLRGKRGIERYVVDAKRRRKSDAEAEQLIEGARFEPPVPGHDVVLTLDADLQRMAEKALGNHPAGGVAVIDVSTGRILALVSKPAFDPNVMTGHLTREEAAAMSADPYKPFLDKTLRQHYYPASTFKFVTMLAALEDNVVHAEDPLTCHGSHEVGKRVFHCNKTHGKITLIQALSQSCNVYFWTLSEKIGIDRIAAVAREFGFDKPTGLGLNGDVPGRIPDQAWYQKKGGYRIGYALNTAIGQGDVEVTVVQLALAYAALANGGNLWVPQIVERVESASGQVIAEYPPTLRRKVHISARALREVARGLWGTVNDPHGSAYTHRIPGIEAAGKTGTAQVRKLTKQSAGGWDPFRDHAWFAGYYPASDPEIAVVVLIEHGGKGGQVAAPVAMEVFRAHHELAEARRQK
jgi:penicillin-binding protein 2